MSLYYFHLEHAHPRRDEQGVDLPDLEAAKCHAIQVIAEELCANPKGYWEADSYQVTVTDEAGLTLFSVAMMSIMAPAMASRQ